MPDEHKQRMPCTKTKQAVFVLFDRLAADRGNELLHRAGTGSLEVNFSALVQLLSAISRQYRELSEDPNNDKDKAAQHAKEADKYGNAMTKVLSCKKALFDRTKQLDVDSKSRQRNTKLISDSYTEIERIIRKSGLLALKESVVPQLFVPTPSQEQSVYQLKNMLQESIGKIGEALTKIESETHIRAGAAPYTPTSSHTASPTTPSPPKPTRF